jgi:predicted  nucleic acid-binding Zn-ribbon protein
MDKFQLLEQELAKVPARTAELKTELARIEGKLERANSALRECLSTGKGNPEKFEGEIEKLEEDKLRINKRILVLSSSHIPDSIRKLADEAIDQAEEAVKDKQNQIDGLISELMNMKVDCVEKCEKVYALVRQAFDIGVLVAKNLRYSTNGNVNHLGMVMINKPNLSQVVIDWDDIKEPLPNFSDLYDIAGRFADR